MRAPTLALSAALVATLSLSACARDGGLIETPPETRWRMVTTPQDRERLRNWRKAWVEALPRARAADGSNVAAQGALFEHDQALPNALPPAGDYRCRTFKLGAQRPEQRVYSTQPWSRCRIARDGELSTFTRLDGAQRPVGTLYADTEARVVFLGSLLLGDETEPLPYGQDDKRDMAGYVERIATARWRLVLPWPAFESQIDVIELIPA